MTKLDDLLVAASAAAPNSRIEYRDRIAEHGVAAVKALVPWLNDARLASFAIRVIRECGEHGERQTAIEALRSLPSSAPLFAKSDASDALSALGYQPARAASTTSAPPPEFNEALYAFLVTSAKNQRVVTYTDARRDLRIRDGEGTSDAFQHRRKQGLRIGHWPWVPPTR